MVRETWEHLQAFEIVPDFGIGAGDDFIETTARKLNRRGQDGWEFVTVLPVVSRQHPASPGSGGEEIRPVM